MLEKIRSVTYEEDEKDISLKDIAKALFAALRGRFGEARSYLHSEGKLVARDANGDLVFGVGGGSKMTIFVKPEKPAPEPPKEEPKPPAISDDALVLQQPMAVRSRPLSLKKTP